MSPITSLKIKKKYIKILDEANYCTVIIYLCEIRLRLGMPDKMQQELEEQDVPEDVRCVLLQVQLCASRYWPGHPQRLPLLRPNAQPSRPTKMPLN